MVDPRASASSLLSLQKRVAALPGAVGRRVTATTGLLAYISAAPSVEQAGDGVTQITSQARRAVDPHRDDERAFPAGVVQMIMRGKATAQGPH